MFVRLTRAPEKKTGTPEKSDNCLSLGQPTTMSSLIDNPIVSEIIPGKLYLSGRQPPSSHDAVTKYKITDILSITMRPVKIPNGIKNLLLEIEDTACVEIYKYFDCTYRFISDSINKENGVCLIHCDAGISRSATIVIAFLMKKYKKSYEKAYKYVEEKRDIINPNSGFRNQLLAYDACRNSNGDISVFNISLFRLTYKIPNNVDDIILKKALEMTNIHYWQAITILRDTEYFSVNNESKYDPMDIS